MINWNYDFEISTVYRGKNNQRKQVENMWKITSHVLLGKNRFTSPVTSQTSVPNEHPSSTKFTIHASIHTERTRLLSLRTSPCSKHKHHRQFVFYLIHDNNFPLRHFSTERETTQRVEYVLIHSLCVHSLR